MFLGWHRFDGVEAQSWETDGGTRKAVLFCPGFPGMGGTIFEQRHAGAMADAGYAVYVLKHKGTRLSGAAAPALINCSARLMDGRQRGEAHLGGGPATIDDWLMEPYKALKMLHTKYDEVHVIGNSFGALAALWSMTEEDAQTSHVKSLILYAGAQGVDEGDEDDTIMRIWRPEFLMAARITDKVALNDPFDIVATLKTLYNDLPSRMVSLPKHIDLSYVVVERDELLRLADTEKFRAAIGGRGNIVIDDYDHAWPELGLLAHDTPNYRTEDLLALIRG